MEIRIGERVRTRVGAWDKLHWDIATIGEVVTGHKGTEQYRLDYDEGGYDYMIKDEFEIVKHVPGVGWISIPAYDAMQKLISGFDKGTDIFNHWIFNQHFIPALVAHFDKIGRKEDAAKVKNEAMNLVWSFDNGRLQCVQYSDADVRPGVYFSDGQEFHGEAGWETIRDFCIPVVMKYTYL